MNFDFEPPSFKWVFLVTCGGVATAIAIILGMEQLSSNLKQSYSLTASATPIQKSPSPISESTQKVTTAAKPLSKQEIQAIAKLDAESIKLVGQAVPLEQQSISNSPYIAPQVGQLTPVELATAKQAWRYFEKNWNEDTGLVNSADGFPAVTLWDQAAAIAALVSAKELGLVTEIDFEKKMRKSLQTLAKLQLYKGELPNKVYNSKTLIPVNYGKLDNREEIGWSALDIGRMAIWLKIVATKYPNLTEDANNVWKSWKVERLTKDGQMYGTSVIKGKESYNQEGRLGYENYAAYGLKLWGLDVTRALDVRSQVAFVDLYGQGIPYDKRDFQNSEANNYVLSEPFILDGIETGFQSLPKVYADRVLAAQEGRYKATNQLTAVTEDNLDRAPYFVYSTLFVNGNAWATITDTRETRNDLRFLSTKAAIGWYVLYNNDYTQKLFGFVTNNLKADLGWYNGFYEALGEPNKSLTANNNGVILESLLYKKVGQPLTIWAGVSP
ncbi:MAG: hypothetical protein DCF19_17430 [Pseudanabaena frigida]|uniref:DUF3131 domain-containing protein n=1 Tax=Pseudanabaena frigida TaxID=945775 RepID=A0A2W4W0G6_9CYAN|nr:MAG: hypothetical protein DCF19_17430 [Pseudanabaena frigida]